MLANGVQLIEFYMDSIEVRDSNGSPNYEPREFVRITHPGGKTVTEREVRAEDKITWMGQYKSFKDGVQYEGEGVHLRDVSFLSKSELENCLRAKVYTVEQLAGVDDVGMKALGLTGRALTMKAKNWLDGRNNIDLVVNKVNALEQQVIGQQDMLNSINGLKADVVKKDATIADLRNQLEEIVNKKAKK